MPEPIEIVFKTKGLDAITRAADRASKAWEKVGSRVQAQAQRGTGAGGGTAAGGVSPAAARSPRVPSPPKPPVLKFAQGPQQRLLEYQRQLAVAQQTGNVPAQKDLSGLIARTQKQIDGPQPQSFGQRLASVIGTARVGGKGGLQPLVGKLAGLAGSGAEAGPYGLAATAAVAAGTAIYKLAEEASAAASKFAALSFATGSTGATAGRLSTLGNSIGLSGEQIGGMSASLQERLTSDPMAMATGRRFGAYNLQRPFGSVDEGANLLKVLNGIADIKNMDERIRAARILGVEGASGYFNQSQGQRDKTAADGSLKAGIFTPKFAEDAADFQSSIARVADSIENVIGALGKPLLNDMTQFFDGLADRINKIAEWLNNHQSIIKDVFEAWGNLQTGNLKGAAESLGKLREDMDKGSTATDALNANTQAHDRNTEALARLTGVFGSPGERFANAIPAGLNSEYLRRSLESGGLRLTPY